MDEHEISRRDVLAGTAAVAAACGACGVVGGAFSGCTSMNKQKAAVTSGTVNIGSAEQFPAGTVNTSLMAQYGIVVTNDSGTAIALRPKCTHMGCTVKWAEEHFQFECPCHGSKFDLLGQVTHGPAKKPLAGVAAVKQGDGTLVVDLDKLYAM